MNPPRAPIVRAAAALTITTPDRAAVSFAFSPPRRGLDGGNRGAGALRSIADNNCGGGGGGPLSKKAYNDDALFGFHMMTQRQKIRDYAAMDTYVDTASAWNLAWHESFVRNGLSDFVPPMTDALNVLVVGNRCEGGGSSLGGPAGDGASVGEEAGGEAPKISRGGPAPLAAAVNGDEAPVGDAGASFMRQPRDSSCSFLTAVFEDYNRLGGDEDGGGDALDLASYDCVMDQGLIADLLASMDVDDKKAREDMARLLYEATKRICEMGIYVANTPPMTPETKEYLGNVGQLLGLQWEFDLDGISDDDVSVSVARKFGTCPTIGWQKMARLIED